MFFVVLLQIFFIAFIIKNLYPHYKFVYFKEHKDKILKQFKKYGFEKIKLEHSKNSYISPSKKWIIYSNDINYSELKIWSIHYIGSEKFPKNYEQYFWNVKSAVKEINKIEKQLKKYKINKKKQDILSDFE